MFPRTKRLLKPQSLDKGRKSAVHDVLGSYFREGKVPGKGPCEEAIKKYPEALKNRDWKALKYFVHYNLQRSKKLMKMS